MAEVMVVWMVRRSVVKMVEHWVGWMVDAMVESRAVSLAVARVERRVDN